MDYNLGCHFYNIANIYPENIALDYQSRKYTYSEINDISNQLARYLLANDIEQSDVVAIFNTKTIYGYALMLACLKIGAIYTNLDPESPASRLEKMIKTCQPKLIFTDNDLNSDNLNLNRYKKTNLNQTWQICSSHPAYIMFTSGSTGNPKGVLISHENIIYFNQWIKTRLNVQSEDRFLQLNPIYFDNSVFDVYGALFNGASLLPVNMSDYVDAYEMVNYIDYLNPTIWFSVPSLFVYLLSLKALDKNQFKSLRIILFGGEGFPKQKLKQLYDLYSYRAELINVYGPTETTCICSSYIIDDDNFADMANLTSLGTINPNFKYFIFDQEQLVSDGDIGELYLGGSNVGLGYYNDLQKTKASFVQNPLIKTHVDILYKTGDLVCVKNNFLYFCGRKDNQIKHLGYRIELEEIESAINSIANIDQSVVIYKKTGTGYGKIIAYISLKLSSNLSENDIYKQLNIILPSYMMPKKIVILPQLPRNRNGKIDRKVLCNNC